LTNLVNAIRRNWLRVLTVILGGLYIYAAIHESGVLRLTGLVGGVLIVIAPFAGIRSRLLGGGLLMMGALPFAILTWWSIVTPLIAACALLLGGIAVGRRESPRLADIRGPAPIA